MTKPIRFLKNERGSIPVVIICSIVLAASIYSVLETIDQSRNEAMLTGHRETKARLLADLGSLLKNSYIVNYSLQTYNKTDELKNCVLSGAPAASDVCDDVNVDFYRPEGTSGIKFAGGTKSPTYLDMNLSDCTAGGQPTESCRYKIVAQCKFTCPGEQGNCALVKTMACDLEVSPYGNSIFRTYKASEKTSMPATIYFLRLDNDLNSLYVVK